jgi:hypothetical protein
MTFYTRKTSFVTVQNKCSKISRKSQRTLQHLAEDRDIFLSELIFTLLYPGSVIQNASDRFVCCIQIYWETFVHRPTQSQPSQQKSKEIRSGDLGGRRMGPPH